MGSMLVAARSFYGPDGVYPFHARSVLHDAMVMRKVWLVVERR